MENEIKQFSNDLELITKANMPEGQFEAILSTESLDRHGEYVSIKGLEIPKGQTFKMYYNHQTWGDAMPIGIWLKVWKSKDGKLMGLGQIDLEDETAVKIYKKIKSGILDSISIGFSGREYDGNSSTWTKSVFREASVVAEPANVEAQVTRKQEKKEELFVGTPGTPPEEVPSVIDESSDDIAEVKTAIEALKSKYGALEAAVNASNDNPSTKQLIHIRLAAKAVDKQAGVVNQVLKIKLSEK